MQLAISLLGYAPPPRPWLPDYCAGMLPALLARPEVESATLLVTPYGQAHWRKLESERVRLRVVEGLDERKRRRFHAERYLLPRLLRELKPDAVFAPLGGSLLLPGARYVYRLASLAYLQEPERFSTLEQLFYGKTIPASCRAADAVLVDHTALADALAQRGMTQRERVTVVEPGCSLAQHGDGLPSGLAHGRYLLCAGSDDDPQLARLLDGLLSHARLPRGWEQVTLVRAGRGPELHHGAGDGLKLLAIEDAPAEVYGQLMRGCALALCLGAGEAGLHPLRQALCAGRPVLCADTPAHRAIAGDSAVYVPPYELTETASSLAVLLAEEGRRSELAQAAELAGSRLQWSKAAERLIGLLSERS